MAETKEGTPVPNSEIPPLLQRPSSVQPFNIDLDLQNPMAMFSKKSPEELKAEAIRLQKAADTMKSHWLFVFLSIGIVAFRYFREIQTTRTLNEIRNYVRSRK